MNNFFFHATEINALKNHFAPKCHEGVHAYWNGSMTPKVENPLMDHFIHIFLDIVIIYEH
jgi:hypothetical protein